MNRPRTYWALLLAQFGGAFNDNLFKIVFSLLLTAWVSEPRARVLVPLAGALFAAPFLIFSLGAGRLADRFSKARITYWVKVAELGIVAVAILGLALQNIPLCFGALFLLATQSAFFGPAKYGMLPEIQEEARLSKANAWLNAGTFLAILTGTLVATFTAHHLLATSLLLGGMAVLGLVAACRMDPLAAVNPAQPLRWNPFPDFFANWRLVKDSRPLRLSLIAVSYFWFLGSVIQMNLIVYVHQVMHLGDADTGKVLAALVLGIAGGSVLAGRLSRGHVELGLVPLGALGVGIFTTDLCFSGGSIGRTLFNAFCLGGAAGIYMIPLETLIQLRSPASHRGRILSLSSFLSFVAILLGSLFLIVLGGPLGASPAQVFLVLGVISLVGTVASVCYLPQMLVRFLLYLLTSSVYRIKVLGKEHVPGSGPALLVANHLSYVDPFLIGASTSRFVRFMMYRAIYEHPLVKPFGRLMDVIPISNLDRPKEIARSLQRAQARLQEGHVVCIFAEGGISRVAQMIGFKRGFERIVRDMKVPVIPVHLDRVWGSIFSFERGRFLWKMPRQIPYPVTVSFGAPLPSTARADEVRQAVMALGTRAFEERLKGIQPLHLFVFRQAQRMWGSPALSDTTGARVSYGRLMTGALLLSRWFSRVLPPEKNVGILLPPGVAGTLVNLALLWAGRVPVNLNYSLGRSVIDEICRQAGLTRIVTAQKVLGALKWEKDERLLILEDWKKPGKLPSLAATLFFRLCPARWVEKTWAPGPPARSEDLAALLFTSGSTGLPKGVMLTHTNIHANLQGLQETYRLTVQDKIAGVLPFFHSFGFTGTLWLPLVAGCQAVYHRSPLEPLAVKKLLREEGATILLGTPTFLQMWMKKLKREDVARLRFVLTGAEKLPLQLAREFRSEFGVEVLEGYGATELSPAVAASVPNVAHATEFQLGSKPGKVGRPLPGVSVRIVDVDSGARLPDGKSGLLIVHGPNVMRGYWNQPEKTAHVMRDGGYVTGDIAFMDEDGFLEITDRLSRFSKIGGEMVPHMLLEQKLAALAGEPEAGFVVLSLPDEKKGEKLVVLVHRLTQNLDDLWKKLDASDLPKLWMPDRRSVYPVPELPTLASGKTDLVKARDIARFLAETSSEKRSS